MSGLSWELPEGSCQGVQAGQSGSVVTPSRIEPCHPMKTTCCIAHRPTPPIALKPSTLPRAQMSGLVDAVPARGFPMIELPFAGSDFGDV